MGELLDRARRTMPDGATVEPVAIAGAGDAVRLTRGTVTRTVTAASAYDDRSMTATWANMAAVQPMPLERAGGAR